MINRIFDATSAKCTRIYDFWINNAVEVCVHDGFGDVFFANTTRRKWIKNESIGLYLVARHTPVANLIYQLEAWFERLGVIGGDVGA